MGIVRSEVEPYLHSHGKERRGQQRCPDHRGDRFYSRGGQANDHRGNWVCRQQPALVWNLSAATADHNGFQMNHFVAATPSGATRPVDKKEVQKELATLRFELFFLPPTVCI